MLSPSILFASFDILTSFATSLPDSPLTSTMLASALSYSKHFGTACGAYPLSCWLAVLHSDARDIFHFLLGAAFEAICLHYPVPLFLLEIKLFSNQMSIASANCTFS